ncbi:MAG: hypothetical protein V1915_01645, partial [Candidatus Bathyarchaeota archaeon]
GTLIFVGIIFTSVIPMYLVMKQADAMYDKKIMEITRLDDERDRENIEAFVYPTAPNSANLLVKIRNRCELAVKVVRLWINDVSSDWNVLTLNSMSEVTLDYPVTQPELNSYYTFKFATERGRVYPSMTGTLYYGDGKWETEFLAIYVIISAPAVKFLINITRVLDEQVIYSEQVMNVGGSGRPGESILETCDVTLSGPGEYHVTVFQAKGSNWTPIKDATVHIDWPNGLPYAWVYS